MQAPLTDEWIEEQLKLCEAASQGPWRDGFDDCSGRISDDRGADITLRELDPRDGLPQCVVEGGNCGGIPVGVLKQEDVNFIIAARAGYAMTLLALRSLRKEVVQCPCCTEFFVKMQEDDVLCPECNRMQAAFNG